MFCNLEGQHANNFSAPFCIYLVFFILNVYGLHWKIHNSNFMIAIKTYIHVKTRGGNNKKRGSKKIILIIINNNYKSDNNIEIQSNLV